MRDWLQKALIFGIVAVVVLIAFFVSLHLPAEIAIGILIVGLIRELFFIKRR